MNIYEIQWMVWLVCKNELLLRLCDIKKNIEDEDAKECVFTTDQKVVKTHFFWTLDSENKLTREKKQ